MERRNRGHLYKSKVSQKGQVDQQVFFLNKHCFDQKAFSSFESPFCDFMVVFSPFCPKFKRM